MSTYKIKLVSLDPATGNASITIQKDGGAVIPAIVSGLPLTDAASFIAAGEAYAIAYYNGVAQASAPVIDPSVTALVGQTATVTA